MILRSSLVKFHTPHEHDTAHPLRIVSAVHDFQPAYFNKTLLKCLEDLKCNGEAILAIFKSYLSRMDKLSTQDLTGLQERGGGDEDTLKRFDPIVKLVQRMFENSVMREQLRGTFLERCLHSRDQKRHAEGPYKIPIPGSYTVLGITNDYQVFPKDHVYIRAKGITVAGNVLIYRNPIIHIGDIQAAPAVTDDSLRTFTLNSELGGKGNVFDSLSTMDNVIFFPKKMIDQLRISSLEEIWMDTSTIFSPWPQAFGIQSFSWPMLISTASTSRNKVQL